MKYEFHMYPYADSDTHTEHEFALPFADNELAKRAMLRIVSSGIRLHAQIVRVDLFREWHGGDPPRHEGHPTLILDNAEVYLPPRGPATLSRERFMLTLFFAPMADWWPRDAPRAGTSPCSSAE